MKVIVVGLGIQGKKRLAIARNDCVATVDPYQTGANYQSIFDVPLSSYDAALVCTPDECKIELLKYLLQNKKHVLVEKPLFAASQKELEDLRSLSISNGITCYTAYNHRFEPHFIRMKKLIESRTLGRIYKCRMFYGNGTAKEVYESAWRDKGFGIITDLGSHLLDTFFYWFGNKNTGFTLKDSHSFENRSPDHAVMSSDGEVIVDLEMSFLSWRNHFTCDLFAENGSAHIESLCKWGPSKFIFRKRKLPSGRPDEEAVTLIQADPTWEAEYKHFLYLCEKSESNIDTDLQINEIFQNLQKTALVGETL
ncbi:MAG: gfo/Idh/MocA family oxidoreductase [Chlamydiae bacterium CG10_big_fil_rev_8_21_14_0_10_35_9]|nr:MAG: gfo/Idh/MocA family oxidoreductase [Chlamydiae bacterium CG10_big_fil_rev_8_21_14_0_10_35_9]